MSSDYHLRCFPYAGVSFPSESPFFPVTFVGSNGEKQVRFNQGYVFDYQSYDQDNKVEGGEEGEEPPPPVGGIKKIKVSIADSYSPSGQFYVKISTSAKSASVSSAELIQGKRDAKEEDFHYSAGNIEGDSIYTDGVGNFEIPACSFNSNGVIEDIYLRENIHWQKINFENQSASSNALNSFGVLYNWGEGEQFKDNPTVKFARIEQKIYSGAFPEGKEKVIKLERSTNNEGNIIVTTQFPEILDDETQILVRKTTPDEWEWVKPDPKDYTQLFYYDGDADRMKFFDIHNGCFFFVKNNEVKMLPHPAGATSEEPLCLKHDGNEPFWGECCDYYCDW